MPYDATVQGGTNYGEPLTGALQAVTAPQPVPATNVAVPVGQNFSFGLNGGIIPGNLQEAYVYQSDDGSSYNIGCPSWLAAPGAGDLTLNLDNSNGPIDCFTVVRYMNAQATISGYLVKYRVPCNLSNTGFHQGRGATLTILAHTFTVTSCIGERRPNQ